MEGKSEANLRKERVAASPLEKGGVRFDSSESPGDLRERIKRGIEEIRAISRIDSEEEFGYFKEKLRKLIDLMEAKEEVRFLAGSFFDQVKDELEEIGIDDFRSRERSVAGAINDLIEDLLRPVAEAEFDFSLVERNKKWIEDVSSKLLRDYQVEDFSDIKEATEILNKLFKKKEAGESPEAFLDFIKNKTLSKALDQKSLFKKVIFWEKLDENGQGNIELLNELDVEYRQAHFVNQLEREFLENLKELKNGGLRLKELSEPDLIRAQGKISSKDFDFYFRVYSGLENFKSIYLDELEGFSQKFEGLDEFSSEGMQLILREFPRIFIGEEGREELKKVSDRRGLNVLRDLITTFKKVRESIDVSLREILLTWKSVYSGKDNFLEALEEICSEKPEEFSTLIKNIETANILGKTGAMNWLVLRKIGFNYKDKEEARFLSEINQEQARVILSLKENFPDLLYVDRLIKVGAEELSLIREGSVSTLKEGHAVFGRSFNGRSEGDLRRVLLNLKVISRLGITVEDIELTRKEGDSYDLRSALMEIAWERRGQHIHSELLGESAEALVANKLFFGELVLYSEEEQAKIIRIIKLILRGENDFSQVRSCGIESLLFAGELFDQQSEHTLGVFAKNVSFFLDRRVEEFASEDKKKKEAVLNLCNLDLFQEGRLDSRLRRFLLDNLEELLSRSATEQSSILYLLGRVDTGESSLSSERFTRRVFSQILTGEIGSAAELDFFIAEIEQKKRPIVKSLAVTEDFSEALESKGLLSFLRGIEGFREEEAVELERGLLGFMEQNKQRNKGGTILVLSMIKELKESISLGGELDVWEALKSVNEKIGMYSEILKKGSADKVPSEVRASIGQEYEVTKSVGEGYYAETGLEYTDVMQIITSQAAIGRGPDGIFEIITQPTDNPYLLILEMKLLQDLDLIDFNFNQYPQAARGYHLTLGGVEGLRPGAHTYFLQNALTCANLVGINAGEDTFSDRRVHDKGGDAGHESLFSEEATSMVEFKNFSCDKWEMFERAVLTSHNAAIAIQAVEKFTDLDSLEKLRGLSGENFGSAREFYDNLKKKGLLKKEVKDDRIKEIVFSWINLQVKFLKMAKDHNENFLNNEMYGYLDEGGDWTDAQDFSSRDNRGEFISYLERINLYRKQAGLEPYSSLEEYFDERQRISDEMLFGDKSSDLSNRLAAVNNFSLKSGVFSGEGSRESGKRKSEVEVDRANVGSVFNTRIGHQKEYLEGFDDKPEETSIFERGGKSRKGYYYFQGFSERMISHQSQVLLLKFNEEMEGILSRETSEGGVTKKISLAA